MSHSRRFSVVLLAVAVLVAIPVAVAATDLDGNISVGSNQWADEHLLCETCTYDSGNIVGVWQAVLWADGFLGRCGSSGVDGWFGSGTDAATIDWQDAHNLDDDGMVGSGTWGKADNFVVSLSAKNAKYDGDDHSYEFYTPGGAWQWDFAWGAQWNDTGHPTPDFPTC
ncbi:MAG: peptidoglycan-binding protein [Acidimicrobiia bacterium]|nr:peptidoglycan-binding protein [Acidimicrobiia bacterium]MDH3396760.1 peptidoglycan-binding protein [Acidimicrobiia bacterium]MDH3731259.1 peptidoglycan-binding protein [Acidimicrobiia bacterium]MDH5422561.1 peptidoglycan-binding protein [Acidimicrobiia bacterium]